MPVGPSRRSSRPRLPHRGGGWRRAWPPAAQSPRARRGEASRARDSRRAAATGMTADRFPDVALYTQREPRAGGSIRCLDIRRVDPRSICPRPRGRRSDAAPRRPLEGGPDRRPEQSFCAPATAGLSARARAVDAIYARPGAAAATTSESSCRDRVPARDAGLGGAAFRCRPRAPCKTCKLCRKKLTLELQRFIPAYLSC